MRWRKRWEGKEEEKSISTSGIICKRARTEHLGIRKKENPVIFISFHGGLIKAGSPLWITHGRSFMVASHGVITEGGLLTMGYSRWATHSESLKVGYSRWTLHDGLLMQPHSWTTVNIGEFNFYFA